MQISLFDPPAQKPKKHIKLLLGGSPCTHWSIAQKKNRETEARGIGWELFRNYLIAKEKFKPDYFLYENNKSAAQPIKDQIAQELGVELQYINSALVSAQNRQRFYAHNIPGVPQPEDRGILLKDILDSGEAWTEKGYCLDANYYKGGNLSSFDKQSGKRLMVAEPIRIGTVESDSHTDHDSKQYRVYSPEGKSTTICGQGGGVGAKTVLYACTVELSEEYYKCGFENNLIGMIENQSVYRNGKQPSQQYRVYSCEEKSVCVDTGQRKHYIVPADGKTYPVYTVKEGLITIKDKTYPIKLPDGLYIIRKLTVAECRRLQTIPDWYTMPCSNTQNYKMLGNGWTVEVIKHILSYIPGISDCTVEVLSMYDGMSCGQIALTELGCKIDRYVSYEIDKYAIQTTQANFPQTEQRGDAFQVRQENWKY